MIKVRKFVLMGLSGQFKLTWVRHSRQDCVHSRFPLTAAKYTAQGLAPGREGSSQGLEACGAVEEQEASTNQISVQLRFEWV